MQNQRNKIVIDHGSYSCKYGISGYGKPEGKIKSQIIYDKKTMKYMIANKDEIEDELYYPIKNGIIQDFDKMKIIWDEIFYKKMKIKPEKCKILLSLVETTDDNYKNKIIKIMLDDYKFDGVQIANQQVLALYGSGKNMGIVVDIGHTITRIVPIYDSYMIHSGCGISFQTGIYINKYINKCIEGDLNDSEMDEIKKLLFIKKNHTQLKKKLEHKINNVNEKINELNKHEMDNILIDASEGDHDINDIVSLILNAIKKSPIDYRAELSKNIMLIGGTSAIPGLCKKLYLKLKKDNENVKVYGYKNRIIASWVGGSIFSCLPTFDKMWINNVA